MKALDDKLFEFFTAFYHFFWDHFGMYLGSLLFILAVFGSFIFNAFTFTIPFVMASMVHALISYYFYTRQAKGLRTLNALTLEWRHGWWRPLNTFLTIGFIAQSAYEHEWYRLASDFYALIWLSYFPCIQVRDREPPQKHSFAPQGAR